MIALSHAPVGSKQKIRYYRMPEEEFSQSTLRYGEEVQILSSILGAVIVKAGPRRIAMNKEFADKVLV